MAKAPDNSNEVDARPTKRLVAYVLTKDIRLEDAILDLVDNSVDGARRTASGQGLSRFHVEILFDPDHFRIDDNCGGMGVDMAREYAFRFGRPKDYAPLDDNARQIGNFGVGMKRALLKMGRRIEIESRTRSDFFDMEIDVEKWLKDDEGEAAWTFAFKNHGQRMHKAEVTGTSIEVRGLYSGVSDRFALDEFAASLHNLIREREGAALSAGLSVAVNGIAVHGDEISLLQSGSIKPIFRKERVGEVSVRFYAGVAQPDNDASGWTIVCNGRTILRADKTPITGWGYKEGADRIPSYHHQFARFRGFVFFDSDKPDALPWNTTKTSVDVEHSLYRKYRVDMIAAMKNVFGFLNDLDKEKDAERKPLEERLDKAKPVALASVRPSKLFVRPKAGAAGVRPTLTWIRYQKHNREVRTVMDSLGVASPAEAGEQTFEIYLNTRPAK